MLKRVFSVIISAIVACPALFSCVPAAAFEDETEYAVEETDTTGESSLIADISVTDDYEPLPGRIRGKDTDCKDTVVFTGGAEKPAEVGEIGLASEQEDLLTYFQRKTSELDNAYIDLSAYNITVDEFPAIYKGLVLNSPLSYYLTGSNGVYRYDYSTTDGVIVDGVWPIYALDGVFDENLELIPERVEELKPEIEANRAIIEAEKDKAMQVVNYGMSQLDMLITFQNYISIHFSYSYGDFYKSRKADRENNTALELIQHKTGMCQAYSVFFNYLCQSVGMETAFVSSKELDNPEMPDYHIWNMVKCTTTEDSGKELWYQVDTTWDDVENDGFGIMDMNYFMLSDDTMRESHDNQRTNRGNVGYGEVDVPTGSIFDNADWRESVSQAVPFKNKWYFIKNQDNKVESQICELDTVAGDSRVICTYNADWGDTNTYAGMGCVNGILYFNGVDCVYKYDIESGTGKAERHMSLNVPEGQKVYSAYIKGVCFYYGVGVDYQHVENGGHVQLQEFAINDCMSYDNQLHMRLSTNDQESDPHQVIFVAKYSDGHLWTYIGEVDGLLWLNFDTDVDGQYPEIYVWDENMKPYVDRYYIDGNLYTYTNNTVAE